MILTQVKYDLKMFFREIFYLVFSVIVPPASYIIMGQIFGNSTYNGGMNYAQVYTPSFIILISFSVIFFAYGFDQVMNRVTGIERRLLITPVTPKVFLISGIIKTILITSCGFLLISIIGVLLYDLKISVTYFLISYLVLMVINAIMLVFSEAVYKYFKDMKSALVMSIVTFQVVMFTGGFAIPVDMLPEFIQVVAKVNPIYHANILYIQVWNEAFKLNNETMISMGYLASLLIVSLLVIKFSKKKG